MTPIEIFMMMYSLLIGLAMAGLLSGIGELLRGRVAPKWGLLVPLAAFVLFVTLLGVFIDASLNYRSVDVSLRSMGIPALAGVFYYLAAVLTVPREQDGWTDLDTYFMARRRLIFGFQLTAYALIVFGVEVPHILREGRHPFADVAYWVGNLTMFTLLAIPIVSQRRIVIVAAMIGVLLMLGAIYLIDQTMSSTLRMLWDLV